MSSNNEESLTEMSSLTKAENGNTNDKRNLNNEDEDLNEREDEIDCVLSSDTQCGFGCGNCVVLRRCANQNSFIIVFGLVGCVMSMTFAYFNGTITTLEKRFHLSSRSIGITQIGKDVMDTATSLIFIHYISKKHRPRWMGFATFTVCLFCLMITLPHWLYGAGEDALKLTTEFGGSKDENLTKILTLAEDTKNLCSLNATIDPCESKIDTDQHGHPMLILFLAQLISGFGMAIFYTLGYVYMDDNVEKSKTASMYSFSLFLNLLGPSCGYTLASICLRQYVAPLLTPVINNEDPRWIGAWWIGWLIFGGLLFGCSFIVAMFPKELPALYRRKKHQTNLQADSLLKNNEKEIKLHPEKELSKTVSSESSFSELLQILKRLLRNKIFMCNNIAAIFFCFGYMPYWIFTPKYLEIVFRQSAAESNVYTGTVALIFTALGVLVSGAIVSWKKPSARILAIWNAVAGILTIAGFLSYSFIGCPGNENSLFLEQTQSLNESSSLHCSNICHCEFVPYAPVCGDNNLTYISACHAGCKELRYTDDGKKLFYDCDCIRPFSFDNITLDRHFSDQDDNLSLGSSAVPGACPVNCSKHFFIFLSILCFLKFIGSTSRTSYFLIQMRSVPVRDKTVAIAFGAVMLSVLSFIPSPIFFGWIIDRMCLVWGKTCSEKSNCWLYDSSRLRYTLNYTATIFFIIGALCDCLNCYLVKDLKIFDVDEEKTQKDKIASNLELAKSGGNI